VFPSGYFATKIRFQTSDIFQIFIRVRNFLYPYRFEWIYWNESALQDKNVIYNIDRMTSRMDVMQCVSGYQEFMKKSYPDSYFPRLVGNGILDSVAKCINENSKDVPNAQTLLTTLGSLNTTQQFDDKE